MRANLRSRTRSPVPDAHDAASRATPGVSVVEAALAALEVPRATSTSCRASRCTACWPAAMLPRCAGAG